MPPPMAVMAAMTMTPRRSKPPVTCREHSAHREDGDTHKIKEIKDHTSSHDAERQNPSAAGGLAHPHWQPTWPAGVRSSDLVRPCHFNSLSVFSASLAMHRGPTIA